MTMEDDFVSWDIGRDEERETLDVVPVDVGHEYVEGGFFSGLP